MTTIFLSTTINAPVQRCFDLARSPALHLHAARHTGERVVEGKTEGLFEEGDIVTWEAVHFGIRQRLQVRITAMQPPHFFADTMVRGTFRSMHHEHAFRESAGSCIMEDRFLYETPFGLAGKVFNTIVLKRYMIRFLRIRNSVLKAAAEGALWKTILA